MSKKLYGLLLPMLAVALMSSASPAFAGNWAPNNAKVLLDSTNLKFEIKNEAGGITTLTCKATVAEGKLGENEPTWTFTPSFSGCTVPATGANTWTATDVNGSEATLTVPNGGAKIAVAAGCEIVVNSSVLGGAGDYINGTNGRTLPSIWELSGSVNVAEAPVNCFNKVTAQKTATVSATINVFNLTTAATAITVH